MKNQVQLITYVDRLGGGGLQTLGNLLRESFPGAFSGLHLLPFYFPIDGADAGFDPIDHLRVDPRLGEWDDVSALSRDWELMADVIVNHMSCDSPQFQDFSKVGAESKHKGLFLTFSSVFPEGASEKDLLALYRPRPGLPLTATTLANGERRLLWTTFTPQQVDIDVLHPQGQAYLQAILKLLSASGVKMIRLDAVGYAIKKAGASGFMMPETFAFIEEFSGLARSLNLEVLVEIHSHYQKQIEIAKQVDWVYDFALPPLVLHAFFFKTARYLKQWAQIRPRNALNVLDTHDGIGIIDIGADASDRVARPGLVPSAELDEMVEVIHRNSGGQSREATGAAASNLDLYQVNCTFYDALARNDQQYLMARAIQFFMPGIPQVYYVGLLAGHNDMALLRRTRVGRDINRSHYTAAQVQQQVQRRVVQQLLALIEFRNTHPAFAGEFTLAPCDDATLVLSWRHAQNEAALTVNFETLGHELRWTQAGQIMTKTW
ncbi:MAG: sucrose phosphorylase [Rhizobacter sp.]